MSHIHKKIALCLLAALVLSSCAKLRKNPERFYFGNYSEAEAAFNKGDYALALDKYSAYIAENPEGNLAVIANYYMAKSYASLGQKDKSAALYHEIIAKHADTVWAKFSQTQLEDLKAGSPAAPPSTPVAK